MLGKKSCIDVCFFCSSGIDEIWVRSTIKECKRQGLSVMIQICSDRSEMDRMNNIYNNLNIPIIIRGSFEELAKYCKPKVVVTASSGVNREIYPTTAKYIIHMPHSLVSLHKIYPKGAFDGYDVLFACGPHQVEEFKKLKEINGTKETFTSYNVGYGKGDIIEEEIKMIEKRDSNISPIVLIAPSWGKDHLLKYVNEVLVSNLEESNINIVIRPHPLIWSDDKITMSKMRDLAYKFKNLKLEDPNGNNNSIYNADIMVGDYSGTSFEYAAYRKRKVISVNVGAKESNNEWREINLPAIETAYREHIGCVVNADTDSIIKAIKKEMMSPGLPDEKTINSFLFQAQNITCGQRATKHIIELVK